MPRAEQGAIPALPVDLDTRVRRVEAVAQRAFHGETLLVPIRTSARQRVSVLTLNEVGSCVWAALGTAQTARSVAARVAAEFEVTAEQAAADVLPFLGRLRELGLVEET
jgi:hypothetical protein